MRVQVVGNRSARLEEDSSGGEIIDEDGIDEELSSDVCGSAKGKELETSSGMVVEDVIGAIVAYEIDVEDVKTTGRVSLEASGLE